MKRIKYVREYQATIIEEYVVDAPEHLLSDTSSDGVNALDVYVTSNSGPDHVDQMGMDEDSLSATVTVLVDVRAGS